MGNKKKNIRKNAYYRNNIKPLRQEMTNALANAIQLHQSGNLRKAEELYTQILESNPNHMDALHLLGVIAYQSGQNEKAVNLISKAIRENGSIPYFHNNLGNALINQGELDEAMKCFEEAIRLKSNYAEPYLNLGNLFKEQNKFDAAIEQYKKAIILKPDYAEVCNNLGNVLKEQGRLDEAIEYLQKATNLKPDFAEAYFNLGNLFKEQKKLDAAIEQYKKAMSRKPDFAEVCNNLGNVLKEQGRLDEAIEYLQKATNLKPDFAEAFRNLGNINEELDRFSEATECYEKALSLKPDLADVYNDLGNVLFKEKREIDKAIGYYQKTIRLKPDHAEAHFNKGTALLLSGLYDEGWSEYEWRFRSKEGTNQIGFRAFTKPKWDGSPLAGKTILVSSEQGVGDTIQFVRYMPLLKAYGGHVIFECHRQLIKLLDGSPGIDQLIEKPTDGIPKILFDVYISLLSMPGMFGTTLDTIPADVSYLRANHELIKKWSDRMDCEMFKVGLVWAGNPKHRNDKNRSCSFSDFSPLASINGLALYSLQKGTASSQLNGLQHEMNIVDLGDQLSGFSDTAAVIANLDLLISVDTAVVHLAGAMGKPVWTILPFVPDWRWMIDRNDSPWYPTMRLFRQSERGDWHRVMMTVAIELEKLVSDATMEKERCPENSKNQQEILMSAGLDR